MSLSIDPAFKKTLFEDGVAKVDSLLDEDLLKRALGCFEWSFANPGPLATGGTEDGLVPRASLEGDVTSDVVSGLRVDNFNPKSLEFYRETLLDLPLADVLRQAWGSEHVWFYAEELFWKQGQAMRTHWHQDLAFLPWRGEHWVNCWISFDRLPKSHSLEVIRGSHHDTLYDGNTFEEDDPTRPLWGDAYSLPRIPDIEAEREVDPTRWDVVSFDIEPGDVVFLHPGSLHGGGAVDEQVPERRTLVLRFFGDDATWSDLPSGEGILSKELLKVTLPPWVERGEPGTPYRDDRFLQLC